MKPPKKVKVHPAVYDIGFDDIVSRAADTDGVCIPTTYTILLKEGNSPLFEKTIMLHEVLHAIWNLTGLSARHDDSDNDSTGEQIIQDLATPLLAVLRDNPQLVKYLTEVV